MNSRQRPKRTTPDLPAPRASRTTAAGLRVRVVALLLGVLLTLGTAPAALSHSQNTEFPPLEPGTRVYDETGSSLTSDEASALEEQLRDLEAIGANAIVMVRARNASPEETLDQVEALQQAWVAETGANQDTAVALLINRNPDDANDARAGIYVGSTYDDGNVPRDEQEAIVSEELIPPLRDGNVYESFSGALTRLERSIVEGPPQSAFERWSSNVADAWLPWAGVGAALAGLAPALAIFRTRQQITTPEPRPTLTRPGTMPPALAGALVAGGPQVSAVPAVILDLATRNAIAIEPEDEGGLMSKPTIQIRLIDPSSIREGAERALWTQLEERAEGRLVSSKNLTKIVHDTKPVREALERRMNAEQWRDPDAPRKRAWLMVIGLIAAALTIFSVVVAAVGESWWPVIGAVSLGALSVTAVTFFGLYPTLTPSGQEAALPWKAYRDGLRQAAKDKSVDMDLNDVLVDTIALNLGPEMDERLKAANEAGEALRAFTSPQGTSSSNVVMFPYWVAFSSSVSTTSGSGASSVTSGGGAGGGGGAAGST